MAKKPIALHQRLRAILRGMWLRSPERSAAMKAGKVSYGRYKCAICDLHFGPKEIQIDHIIPCGKLTTLADLPGFVERLFTGQQVTLCKNCHKIKTTNERALQKKGILK